MEIGEIEEKLTSKSKLLDLTVSENNFDVNQVGCTVEGLQQYSLLKFDPDAEKSVSSVLDGCELWFNEETGERVEEPAWFRKNEETFKESADKLGRGDLEGFRIDEVPYTLFRRCDNASFHNVLGNPYLTLENGVVYEVKWRELVKLLVNEGKISHPEFYLDQE